MIAVPLSAKGRVIGLLEAFSPEVAANYPAMDRDAGSRVGYEDIQEPIVLVTDELGGFRREVVNDRLNARSDSDHTGQHSERLPTGRCWT